ncbi:MAG TPA: FtsX-like permease family protein [Thermoleophilia bacterium]|nr:FtsX-like permease family protein [Thermoleophilia bacterium]
MLVLILLVLAIAATIVGLGAATNAAELKADPNFGTADTTATLPGGDPQLAADLAAMQAHFGVIDVIAHQHVPVPGSVATLDVRAENPHAPYGGVTLRLDHGRYPTAAGEVAVTSEVAKTFAIQVGSTWQIGGRALHVVGIVENPLDLTDQFALVAPGQANPPSEVSVLFDVGGARGADFRLPSGTGLAMASRGTTPKAAVAALVLVIATLAMVFVGLLAVAGFTVMAQRRLRALGMFSALGATEKHLRRVVLANGAVVGTTAAAVGTVVGLVAWFAFVPTFQSIVAHRVDPFSLPWWAVGAAILLTIVTALLAAWWPARSVSRISVVAALSGRPPRPQPAHRFAALGGLLLAGGIVLLAFGDLYRTWFIICGTVATAVGVLFLAPLAIRVLAAAGQRASISVRLALRDLVRYQARSGAALGAITLAIGISATIAISASAARPSSAPSNLPTNQLAVYISQPNQGDIQIPPLTAAQLQAATAQVNGLAAQLHATSVVPLEMAYNPQSEEVSAQIGPGGQQPAGYMPVELTHVYIQPHGEEITGGNTLYVATPAVLSHYGINENQISPTADILSSQKDLGGLQIFDPDPQQLRSPNTPGSATPGSPAAGTPGSGPAGLPLHGPAQGQGKLRITPGITPTLQTFSSLPAYTSAPGTLLTPHAMSRLGYQAIAAGWLVQTPTALSPTQIGAATRAAAAAGLLVESHKAVQSNAPLRNWATAVGALVALGVLGMTVGLIRSETASDLRTLTATGASSRTRRNLTAATSAALAFLGALLGTAGAYAALLAWHRSDLNPLNRVPVANLIEILAVLPLVAAAAGWLLAGREPAVISRQPLE